jgi:hypothetical protein
VDHADGQRRALGIEALDVIISREEAAIAVPLIRRDPPPPRRRAERTRQDWTADIAGDPEGVWRSPWLAACARHAIEQAAPAIG